MSPYSKVTVVAALLASTVPLSVAPVEVTLVAAFVVTVGGEVGVTLVRPASRSEVVFVSATAEDTPEALTSLSLVSSLPWSCGLKLLYPPGFVTVTV